jgi:hypothetical protein
MSTLPNCLTRSRKTDDSMRSVLGAQWFYLFCANCGADGGRVLDSFLPEQYAFYLCNDCAEKYGEIAGTMKTSDEEFRTKVTEAMVEEFGHALTEPELLIQLDDKHSTMSKLEREGRQRR